MAVVVKGSSESAEASRVVDFIVEVGDGLGSGNW